MLSSTACPDISGKSRLAGKNLSLLFITFLFLQFNAFAQAPDTMWTKTFGGTGSEYGSSVQQTSDGGYILFGSTSTYGAGDSDIWLIKTDENGNELWNKTFGGINLDYGRGQQTLDGGYIICGGTESFGAGNFDAWLIKTDENGNELWNKTFGSAEIDAGQSVQQTVDGGYIIAGYTLPLGATLIDAWLIKTDENGNELWSNTYGGANLDRFTSVQQTSDSGYVATGFTESFGAQWWDVILIKTNSNGEELWIKTFGGSTDDACSSVLQTLDGGYILVGMTTSYGAGGMDLWLIKTDENGDELWNKTFGDTDSDQGASVIQNSDGSYIISGSTSSYGTGNSDIWLIKTDENGNEIWSTTYGKTDDEYSSLVQQTSDGGYIISGTIGTFFPGEDSDIWLIKTESDPASIVIDLSNTRISSYNFYQNYPNPFNPSTSIRYSVPQSSNVVIKIFDILGKEIETLVNEEKPIGTYELTWYAESAAGGLPSGIYFYRIQAGSFVETKKMVLLR